MEGKVAPIHPQPEPSLRSAIRLPSPGPLTRVRASSRSHPSQIEYHIIYLVM